MTEVFAEICVPRPENTIAVVETLVKNGFMVVIRANAYDEGGPTIFVHAYGYSDIPNLSGDNLFRADTSADEHAASFNLLAYLEQMLDPVRGDVLECGGGHQDTAGEVIPPVGLAFAIDVFDDHNDIMHRISCEEYSPDRFVMMMIEAAGRFAKANGRSVGNALARRILLAALGPIDDEDEDEDEDTHFVPPANPASETETVQ